MNRTLLCLLALLLAATLPALALAEEGDGADEEEGGEGEEGEGEGDEEPPWVTEATEEGEGDSQAEAGGDSGASEASTADGTAAATDSVHTAWRTGGAFGLGFSIGTTNGLSMKIWPNKMHGLVIHIGTPVPVLNALSAIVSYRVHPTAIAIPNSPVGLRVVFNVGPTFRARMVFYSNGTFTELAGGLSVGASVLFATAPVEIFTEIAPMFGGGIGPLGDGVGFAVDGLVGARFYF